MRTVTKHEVKITVISLSDYLVKFNPAPPNITYHTKDEIGVLRSEIKRVYPERFKMICNGYGQLTQIKLESSGIVIKYADLVIALLK